MQLPKLTKFIIAIVLQVVILVAIILYKVSILSGGTEVLLRIEPIDPRSPLRGDYITFQYGISNLDSYHFNYSTVNNGDTVYVSLRQTGEYYEVLNASLTKPTIENALFIKGKVGSGGSDSGFGNIVPNPSQIIHVVYGIEEYFIPEGTGQNVSFFEKNAAARVVIDDEGDAVLKQILVDGKPWPNNDNSQISPTSTLDLSATSTPTPSPDFPLSPSPIPSNSQVKVLNQQSTWQYKNRSYTFEKYFISETLDEKYLLSSLPTSQRILTMQVTVKDTRTTGSKEGQVFATYLKWGNSVGNQLQSQTIPLSSGQSKTFWTAFFIDRISTYYELVNQDGYNTIVGIDFSDELTLQQVTGTVSIVSGLSAE